MKRFLLAVVVVVVLLPVLAVLGAGALLQSGPVRGVLREAVQGATGHRSDVGATTDVAIRGLWRLRPALEVRNVRLENPPGFSRPDFAIVKRVEVELALLPLFSRRVDIRDITLAGVDVLLERDKAGRGNWEPEGKGSAGGEAGPQEARPAEPSGSSGPSGWSFGVAHVAIEDVRVAMLGGPAVSIGKLEGSPMTGGLAGDLVLNGVAFAVKGSLGAGGAGLPVLNIAGPGLVVDVTGQAGDSFAVQARAADLAVLSPLAGRALPPLRDVALSGQVGPGAAGAFHLTAGAGDLGAWWPGLRLTQLDVVGAGMDRPVQMKAVGLVRALPVAVAVNVATLSALLGAGPVPVQAVLSADAGTVTAQGVVAEAGPELTVSARVPDLRRSGALAGVGLPGLREVALDVRLAAGGGGVLARGLRVTSAQGDLAGDLAFRATPRRSVRGSLVSQRLDLDGLLAPEPVGEPSPAGLPAAAGPAPERGDALGRALPFAALRQVDADVHLAARQVVLHGGEFRALEARVLLQDGVLRVDPAQVLTPGGSVQVQVAADANATPPTASFTMLAPALGVVPLVAAFGVPDAATGAVDVDIQVSGAGADLRAMAGTVAGHVGLAFVDGDVDNALLASLFGGALRAANLPVEVGGRSRVRCFAVRADAAGGQATVKALALDAGRARLDGDGSVNLKDATMDLHLRPIIRIGSTGVAVPVRLSGPLGAPVPSLERGALSPGRVGISIGAAPSDPCGPALAAARDGRPGALPR